MPASPAQRIVVYGVTGSGKSTAASRISRATGLPWHSVDDLTWEPDWIQIPTHEQRDKIHDICTQQQWILDSAYGQWLDIPLARADLIVALDYPRWLSLSRLLRRSIARVINRTTVCNGNRETIRTLLAHDSILRWHFRSFRTKRARIRQWAANPDGPTVHRFRRPRDLTTWIDTLHR
ncbi:adenylate kinase [Saccharopolyspora shandongensis]|uniref:adenylate kinase n=1 Tax=Saccharopolyspora shandongensis TaxID=418495 RepID=UPI0033D82721